MMAFGPVAGPAARHTIRHVVVSLAVLSVYAIAAACFRPFDVVAPQLAFTVRAFVRPNNFEKFFLSEQHLYFRLPRIVALNDGPQQRLILRGNLQLSSTEAPTLQTKPGAFVRFLANIVIDQMRAVFSFALELGNDSWVFLSNINFFPLNNNFLHLLKPSIKQRPASGIQIGMCSALLFFFCWPNAMVNKIFAAMLPAEKPKRVGTTFAFCYRHAGFPSYFRFSCFALKTRFRDFVVTELADDVGSRSVNVFPSHTCTYTGV
jgi:hypothetical protein